MKESKLMKEVVERSLNRELDDISERIIEAHEAESAPRSVTVRPRYISGFAACLILVFSVGVIAGVLIMRSSMRRESNTAPDIVDTRADSSAEDLPGSPAASSSSSKVSSDTVMPDIPVNAKYVDCIGVRFYAKVSDTEYAVRKDDIRKYAVTPELRVYLSSVDFMGFVDNESTEEKYDMYSNCMDTGALIFKIYNQNTVYVYKDEWVYVFGNDVRFELPQGAANISALKSGSRGSEADKWFMTYDGKSYYFAPNEIASSIYIRQGDYILGHSSHDTGRIFLGTLTTDSSSTSPNRIFSNYLPSGAALFYDPGTNSIVSFSIGSKYSEARFTVLVCKQKT